MATTTNYSWTTPDDTALVKDGAAAIRSLGTAIDSTVFTNAGNAINKTIVDAKGDIIAATAADTVSRLAVGANDTVLVADSSTATGLKWASVSSSPGSAENFVSTSETTSSGSYTNLTTTQAITLTTGTKVMVVVSSSLTRSNQGGTSSMSYEISGATTSAASDNYRVFYKDDASLDTAFQMSYVSFRTVTAGSNTFTAKFKSSGNASTFANRTIAVIDLGS
jgi:hypothetical protein